MENLRMLKSEVVGNKNDMQATIAALIDTRNRKIGRKEIPSLSSSGQVRRPPAQLDISMFDNRVDSITNKCNQVEDYSAQYKATLQLLLESADEVGKLKALLEYTSKPSALQATVASFSDQEQQALQLRAASLELKQVIQQLVKCRAELVTERALRNKADLGFETMKLQLNTLSDENNAFSIEMEHLKKRNEKLERENEILHRKIKISNAQVEEVRISSKKPVSNSSGHTDDAMLPYTATSIPVGDSIPPIPGILQLPPHTSSMAPKMARPQQPSSTPSPPMQSSPQLQSSSPSPPMQSSLPPPQLQSSSPSPPMQSSSPSPQLHSSSPSPSQIQMHESMLLNIDLGEGGVGIIEVDTTSEPVGLAFDFLNSHQLSFDYLEPLVGLLLKTQASLNGTISPATTNNNHSPLNHKTKSEGSSEQASQDNGNSSDNADLSIDDLASGSTSTGNEQQSPTRGSLRSTNMSPDKVKDWNQFVSAVDLYDRASILANNGSLNAAVRCYSESLQLFDSVPAASRESFGLNDNQLQRIKDEAMHWIDLSNRNNN